MPGISKGADRIYLSIIWADVSSIDVIFSLVANFPELGFPSRDIKHVCICVPLSVNVKGTNISASSPRVTEKKTIKR